MSLTDVTDNDLVNEGNMAIFIKREKDFRRKIAKLKDEHKTFRHSHVKGSGMTLKEFDTIVKWTDASDEEMKEALAGFESLMQMARAAGLPIGWTMSLASMKDAVKEAEKDIGHAPNSPFMQGRHAYVDGALPDDNPHEPKGSANWQDWEKGYKEAHDAEQPNWDTITKVLSGAPTDDQIKKANSGEEESDDEPTKPSSNRRGSSSKKKAATKKKAA